MNEPQLDETHDCARRSWVESANADGCDFPIQNLPFGLFCRDGGSPRFGIAIGNLILDVVAAADAGLLFDAALDAAGAARQARALNAVLALEPATLTALRRQAAALLDSAAPESVKGRARSMLHEQADCMLHVPVEVGDFTDFFAGIHHASTTGAILKPDDPLPPTYKWIPVAYHARSSSVVVSGTGVHRPAGQVGSSGGKPPRFFPTRRLDFELELGFYIGRGNPLGKPIPIAEAGTHIAGYCLLNDWSARDMQRWESLPLGPFLSKSFATTVSPWVVTVDALKPFRCAALSRAAGDPPPLAYLADDRDRITGGLNIEMSAWLQTPVMRAAGAPAVALTHSNAKYLYWTPAQMVTHHSSGGCNLRPGDLIGSGTISGPERTQRGSMLELSNGGRDPIALPSGETRGFLDDGDEVTFRAMCRRDGFAPIGFGRCVGRIAAARPYAVAE